MWFHYTLEIPAGTPEKDAIEKELNLTYGIIKYIAIPWDPSVNRLVKVRIYRFRHQIFPINPDEPACGSGFVEGGEEHLEFFEPPHVLLARGYAPVATYDHDITILINVLPVLAAEPWRAQAMMMPRRVEWLGSVS